MRKNKYGTILVVDDIMINPCDLCKYDDTILWELPCKSCYTLTQTDNMSLGMLEYYEKD